MSAKSCAAAAAMLVLLEPASASVAQKPALSSTAADHLALHVADMQASISFYRDLFGFAEIPAPGPAARWLDLGGGMALHLIGGRTLAVTPVKSVHLALTTRDLTPVLGVLRRRQIRWSDWTGETDYAVNIRADGVRQIFFQDPDGYWLEVNDALGRR